MRVKLPGQKQGTLIKGLEISKSVGHFQAETNSDSGREMNEGPETGTRKDLVTETLFNLGTSANRTNKSLFGVPETARLFTLETPLSRKTLSDEEKQASDESMWQTGSGMFGTLKDEKQQASVEIIRRSVESLNTSNLFSSRANIPPGGTPSNKKQPAGHSDEVPLRCEITEVSSLNRSGPEHAPSGPLQPEASVRPLKTGRSPRSLASASGKQSPQVSNNNQFLNPASALSVSLRSVSSTTSSRRSQKTPPTTRNPEVLSTGEQTPPSEFSDDSCRSSPCDDEPDSDDNSSALMPWTPLSRYNHDSNTGAVIQRSPPGAVDLIWEWRLAPRTEKLFVDYWIWKCVTKDLTKNEESAGYIYAFQVTDPQGSDFVKIGKAKTVKDRMRDHEVCYGKCNRIYPPQGESAVQVPHYARVEKLIHFELMQHALWMEMCPKNRFKHKKHREWFEVGQQHAIAVIRKWSDWVKNSPYEQTILTGEELEVKREKEAKRKEAKRGTKEKGTRRGKKSGNHEGQGTSSPKVWHLKYMDLDDLMSLCSPLCHSLPQEDDEDIEDIETRTSRSASALVLQSD
jgi:T5orf172 domain